MEARSLVNQFDTVAGGCEEGNWSKIVVRFSEAGVRILDEIMSSLPSSYFIRNTSLFTLCCISQAHKRDHMDKVKLASQPINVSFSCCVVTLKCSKFFIHFT